VHDVFDSESALQLNPEVVTLTSGTPYIYTHTHTHIYICTHTHTHTYIHIYTHTHTHWLNMKSCNSYFLSLFFLISVMIYRAIILPAVMYGCETWSLTLREKRRLRVFENRVLRIFGPMRDEVTGNGENYKMRSLMICIPHPILFG